MTSTPFRKFETLALLVVRSPFESMGIKKNLLGTVSFIHWMDGLFLDIFGNFFKIKSGGSASAKADLIILFKIKNHSTSGLSFVSLIIELVDSHWKGGLNIEFVFFNIFVFFLPAPTPHSCTPPQPPPQLNPTPPSFRSTQVNLNTTVVTLKTETLELGFLVLP